MNSSTLFVHCGYPKTATTTLQSWVFPSLPGVKYAGKLYGVDSRQNNDLVNIFRYRVPRTVVQENQIESGMDQLRRSRLASGGRVLVSAEEVLAQCMLPMQSQSRLIPAPSLSEALLHIRKIAKDAGFDDVKAIVTLRRQTELLSSFYAEAYMARYRRINPLNTFPKFVDYLINTGNLISSGSLDFCILEDTLKSIFGASGYHFLLFEWLKQRQEIFEDSLAGFLGIPSIDVSRLLAPSKAENVRRGLGEPGELKVKRRNVFHFLDQAKRSILPNHSLRVGRRLGPLLKRIEFGPATIRPESEDLGKIQSHYAVSNQRFVSIHKEFSALTTETRQLSQ